MRSPCNRRGSAPRSVTAGCARRRRRPGCACSRRVPSGLAELRAQAVDRAPEQLTRARRGDAERRRDVLEGHLLDVVQAEQRDVALLEAIERFANAAEELAARGQLVGALLLVDEDRRVVTVDRLGLEVDEAGEVLAVVLDADAE